MKPLTSEQNKVFSFIVERLRRVSVPPTIREIGEHLGYKSINNVRQHLRLIEQKGYIRLLRGKARGIEVTAEMEREPFGTTQDIPLVGAVAAGRPITAMENVDEYIAIDSSLFKGRGLFTLRIQGDSMNGIGVFDGDIVIVRQDSNVKHGDIVVAIIDDEATLKRYRRREDGAVVLHPENPAYQDIVITPDRNIHVAGKMVGLIRKY